MELLRAEEAAERQRAAYLRCGDENEEAYSCAGTVALKPGSTFSSPVSKPGSGATLHCAPPALLLFKPLLPLRRFLLSCPRFVCRSVAGVEAQQQPSSPMVEVVEAEVLDEAGRPIPVLPSPASQLVSQPAAALLAAESQVRAWAGPLAVVRRVFFWNWTSGRGLEAWRAEGAARQGLCSTHSLPNDPDMTAPLLRREDLSLGTMAPSCPSAAADSAAAAHCCCCLAAAAAKSAVAGFLLTLLTLLLLLLCAGAHGGPQPADAPPRNRSQWAAGVGVQPCHVGDDGRAGDVHRGEQRWHQARRRQQVRVLQRHARGYLIIVILLLGRSAPFTMPDWRQQVRVSGQKRPETREKRCL